MRPERSLAAGRAEAVVVGWVRAHHSRKFSDGASGRSRAPVHMEAGKGSAPIRPSRPTSRVALAAFSARPHSRPLLMAGRVALIATSHMSGTTLRLTSTVRARRWMRIVGMSMPTGQASPQAPHSEEAKGSVCTGSSSASPWVSWGVMIAPMGPG